jgi:hypothetical protein
MAETRAALPMHDLGLIMLAIPAINFNTSTASEENSLVPLCRRVPVKLVSEKVRIVRGGNQVILERMRQVCLRRVHSHVGGGEQILFQLLRINGAIERIHKSLPLASCCPEDGTCCSSLRNWANSAGVRDWWSAASRWTIPRICSLRPGDKLIVVPSLTEAIAEPLPA